MSEKKLSADSESRHKTPPQSQDPLRAVLSRVDGLLEQDRLDQLLASRSSFSQVPPNDIDLLISTLKSRLLEAEKENQRLRRQQDLLHAGDDKYRNLVETISHGIQEVDVEGRIIFANKSLHRIYGYEDGELIGRDILDLIALENDRQKLRDYLAAIRQGQVLPIPCQCRSLTKTGRIIDVTVNWNYKRDPAGLVTGMILIVTDITMQKKAEEALRESEEKFRRTFDQSPMGAVILGLDLSYLRANAQFCRLTGYSESELLKKTVTQITHPEDTHKDYRCAELLQQGKAEHCQTDKRYIRKDGSILWARVYTRLVRDAAAKPLYFLPLIEDITDRKQAEDELLFKNTLLQAQSETSTEGILVVDNLGNVISHNRRFMRMWKIPQSLMDAGDDAKLIDFVLNQLREPSKFLEKIRYLYEHKLAKTRDYLNFKDGRIFERYSAALIGAHGVYYGRIWYFRDVTTQKHAEHKILKLNEELELRVAERTARLARDHRCLIQEIEDRKCLEREILDISEREKKSLGRELHDSVGQQLTGVAFMAKAMAQDMAAENPDQAANAEQIARFINEALDKTRSLARGLHPVDLTPANLTQAIRDLAAHTEHLFGIRCLCRLNNSIQIDDCTVAVHIYRIVQEAITNAHKHGKARNIFIRLTAFGDKFVLTVRNDGEDFPEVMPGSTGIGLQIMGHRIELIDGTLDIRRGEKGGTVVTCVLPNKPQGGRQ